MINAQYVEFCYKHRALIEVEFGTSKAWYMAVDGKPKRVICPSVSDVMLARMVKHDQVDLWIGKGVKCGLVCHLLDASNVNRTTSDEVSSVEHAVLQAYFRSEGYLKEDMRREGGVE